MIAVRELRKEDENFIYATYLKNNWYNKDNDTTLKKDSWMRLQHSRLEGLFNKSPEVIKIVCLDMDSNTILGYKVESFTYIRPQWRNVANIEEMLK